MSCHKLTTLLYASYGYICGSLFHTIARQAEAEAEAEEEAALEPHGLGFKAGAACSYDSLRGHWQQRKQQQSTRTGTGGC